MIPGITRGLSWGTGSSTPPDGGSSEDPEPAAHVTPSERAMWARWATRFAAAVTAQGAGHPSPLTYRALATRIIVHLLAHGIWEPGDASWREILARLAASLVPGPADNEPGQVRQVAASLTALCMGLLRTGVSMTGGSTHGALAARTWTRLKPLVADADPDLVTDLLMPPVHAHAVTLNLSELEETILLARDDDPAAVLTAELAGRGWHLTSDGLMYRVTGTFTNPLNAAAQVATRLGRSLDAVLVHAQATAGVSSPGAVPTCCWPACPGTPGVCTGSTGPPPPSPVRRRRRNHRCRTDRQACPLRQRLAACRARAPQLRPEQTPLRS